MKKQNNEFPKTQFQNNQDIFNKPKPRNFISMTNTNISQYQIEKISSKNIITKKLKETSDDFSYENSKSILIELNEVENDFKKLEIIEKEKNNQTDNKNYEDDFEMSSIDMYKLPWYDQYINDLSEDDFNETNSSSFNYEYEIPDLTRDPKIRGKIISNAIEIEKTARKFFDVDLKLIPNKR